MDEPRNIAVLRKWVDVALRVRATCQSVGVFDRLIQHQRRRLEELERLERERQERERRLSFGFSDQPDSGTVVGTLPPRPKTGRGRRRTAEEAETDRQLRKEQERTDLDLFLPCYRRATGVVLEVEEEAENPDFIATRSDGERLGIELTAVREAPVDSFYRPILTGNPEWDPMDAVDQMMFLIEQKSSKIKNYQTSKNILVLQNEESDFAAMCADVKNIPIEDFQSAGFDEIWLADYSGIRRGIHSEIELFGMYPVNLRTLTPRSDRDKKPYR
jgi:hypothetical protein